MEVYSASRGIISHCALYTVPVQTHGSELSERCNVPAGRHDTHTELYKENTLLRGTITLIDALPVQERRHDRKQERG